MRPTRPPWCSTGSAGRATPSAPPSRRSAGTTARSGAPTPMLRGETLAALIREHWAQDAAATALTARLADPTGYGRIIRDDAGAFMEIIEEADATPEQRAIQEINSGFYAFEAHLLGDVIKRVPTDH